MKNLKNLAAFVATAALATAAMAQNVDNWRNASGDVWKNSTGLCWRDANWTPATAAPGCDGAVAAAAKPAVAARAQHREFVAKWSLGSDASAGRVMKGPESTRPNVGK